MLPEYVWDAGVLEGNPFTFPEVKTLLEGVTVGGRKLSDQEQILNLADSSKYLVELVKQGQFRLDKDTFCSLNARVARNEALEWGHFRGEGAETSYTPDVALGERGRFTPLPTERGAARLNEVFANGVRALQENVSNPFERAAAFFLFGSLQQFFFDGNKRTSRFMMNGLLMTEGIDAVSIPAVRATAFNSRMVDFYVNRDATEMMAFVLDCHPEITQIRQLNPGLSVIKDAPKIEYFRLNDPMDTQGSGHQSTEETRRAIYHEDAQWDRESSNSRTGQAPDRVAQHARGIDQNNSSDSAEPRQRLVKRQSIEEMQRTAAENWRRKYYDKRTDIPRPEPESTNTKENTPEAGTTSYERDAGIDFDPER
jgi:prophage maintenance system killer protein